LLLKSTAARATVAVDVDGSPVVLVNNWRSVEELEK
jgi:hypothetical protein